MDTKSNRLKSILFAALTVGLLSACINDDNYNAIDNNCISASPSKTIDDIYSVAADSAKLHPEDDIIEAYVTSSDAGGTFYKSVSFQSLDGTKAFSIPVDLYNSYTELEPGRKVYVYLKNKYFNITYNSLIIGNVYQDTLIGRLTAEDFRKTVKASCESVNEDQLVQHLSITEALNDNNINKLIEFDSVQFADEALNTTYYNPNNTVGGATNIFLVDEEDHKIIFRTSEFAKFAGHEVPSGNGKVRGILTKYKEDFQFMARTENDIQLTNTRLAPLFEETFSGNFPLWTKFSVTGTQVWTLDTTYGNPGACAKMSGYASGNKTNEDWLISPAINLSGLTKASLSFDTATDFNGDVLQILISTDYSGSGTPKAANWTPLTATLSPTNGNYLWTNSGKIDLSDFIGDNIYIAFKYTSTAAAAAIWEVDNVKIKGK